MKNHTPTLRPAQEFDIPALNRVAEDMGARHEKDYFVLCLAEQSAARRHIIVIDDPISQKLLGYAQIIWSPQYPIFRRLDIPEIQDLNVIPEARRQGWGEKLSRTCETAVKNKHFTRIGISVGLHPGFGAAQRLYVRLGYIPDGYGVAYDEKTVSAGDLKPMDGFLALKMIKDLLPSPKS